MEFDRLHDDETTEVLVLLAVENDPLEVFLSRLDEQDGAMPNEEGGWQHVRFKSYLHRTPPTHSWMLVLAECLFFSFYGLHFVKPATGSVRSASPDKSLVLNVGYNTDEDAPDLERPLLFYAGDQFPIDECLPVIKREWRLYGDLGIAPKNVFIVIRVDQRCPQRAIADFMQLIYDAGFRNIRLRATIDPNKFPIDTKSSTGW